MHFTQYGKKFDPFSYKRSDILRLNDICLLQTALFVHKFKNKNLPEIFDNYFRPVNPNGDMTTRNGKNNYYNEFAKTKFAKCCIKSTAIIAWEQVPDNLKDVIPIHIFKKRFKKFLINRYLLQINY